LVRLAKSSKSGGQHNEKHLLPVVGLGHVPPEGRSILGAGTFCRRSGVHPYISSVAKLPNIPGLRVEGSRVKAQRRRNPDLYNVMVEIDVSIVGESETYVFNCIRNGQLTLIQPMGMRPGSMARGFLLKIRRASTVPSKRCPITPVTTTDNAPNCPWNTAHWPRCPWRA
jgi:hypothetical protein